MKSFPNFRVRVAVEFPKKKIISKNFVILINPWM
jgi:hypothetical protein